MAKNSIGGFFVDLALKPDKNSFETGNKLIDGVTGSFNKLIGTARNAAVVLATTAVASSAIAAEDYKMAQAIGVSTEKLDLWKTAAKVAGVNANGLVGSIGKLANVMNHLTIDGRGLEQYSKSLGELGLSFTELEKMDPAEAYKKILKTAQEQYKSNPIRVTTIVGDILGTEGQKFFSEIQRQNKSVDSFLEEVSSVVFTNSDSNRKGQDFAAEVGLLKAEIGSLNKLIGETIGGELIPIIQKLTEKIKPIGETLAMPKYQSNQAVNLKEKFGEHDHSGFLGLTGEYDYKTLKDDVKDEVAQYYAKYGNYNGLFLKNIDQKDVDRRTKSMKDGIMRPDGTVTQVAPDDWVFAAKNVGDLARAFLPQNYNASAQNSNVYTINQTFNISGSKDIPQVLKQQAYRGTQEGLMQVMSQSSQRMQLMSGLR